MKYQNYFLCSHQQCIQNNTYLFPQEQKSIHKSHQFASARLDEVYYAYKQMVEEKHKVYLQSGRKQIIEEMEIVIMKLFQKSSKCLTILKNQFFAPKSPLSFTYQQISCFYFKNKRPLQLSIQNAYQQIGLQYKPIYLKWKQQLHKLQTFIQLSIVNQQISPELKIQPENQNQISPQEQSKYDQIHKIKKIKKMGNKIKMLMQKKRQKTSQRIDVQISQQQKQELKPYIQSEQHILKFQNEQQLTIIPQIKKIRSILVNSNKIRQYKINQILKETQSIKQITFNTNYKVNRYFYNKCIKNVAAQLTHLYQLWNQGQKFKQRQSFIYFPRELFNQNIIQRSHIQFLLWNKFKQLKTLWIANMNDYTNARSCENSYKQLEYLNLQPCICCPSYNYESIQILGRFGSSNKLSVLILRNLPLFPLLTQAIIKCFNNNKKIRVFIMNSQKIEQSLINRLSLTNLTNLCLKSSSIYGSQQINIQPIFKLHQLKYLSLVNFIFCRERKHASSVISNFANLSQLVYLNLYHSYPVYSQIFDHLHPNLIQSLKTLILGLTHIDDLCIDKIIQLDNLQELNLDGTQIQIEKMSEICQQPCLKLKSISLFGCNKQSVKQLPFIPQRNKSLVGYNTLTHLYNIYPNLSYINIARCGQDIALFNWKQMKSLQFLTVSTNVLNKKYMKQRGIQIYEI